MAQSQNRTFGVKPEIRSELDALRRKGESFTKYFERVMPVLKEIEP